MLALCYTHSQETYHHWRIFAPTSSGVRITFNEQLLRNSAIGIDGLQLAEVEYVKLADIRKEKLSRQRLPFIKRHPYRQESEVRLLGSPKQKKDSLTPCPLNFRRSPK